MNNLLFAHAGEHHETAAEAAQHAASNGLTISTPVLFWLALIIIPAILLLTMYAFKIKLTTRLLVLSTFLIVFSIISYQEPGVYSALALAIGFGIVLLQSIIGLSASDK